MSYSYNIQVGMGMFWTTEFAEMAASEGWALQTVTNEFGRVVRYKIKSLTNGVCDNDMQFRIRITETCTPAAILALAFLALPARMVSHADHGYDQEFQLRIAKG